MNKDQKDHKRIMDAIGNTADLSGTVLTDVISELNGELENRPTCINCGSQYIEIDESCSQIWCIPCDDFADIREEAA